MRCPSCGIATVQGVHFCGQCGTMPPKHYPACGFTHPGNYVFCGQCGAHLRQDTGIHLAVRVGVHTGLVVDGNDPVGLGAGRTGTEGRESAGDRSNANVPDWAAANANGLDLLALRIVGLGQL